jgi:hypothetical protein
MLSGLVAAAVLSFLHGCRVIVAEGLWAKAFSRPTVSSSAPRVWLRARAAISRRPAGVSVRGGARSLPSGIIRSVRLLPLTWKEKLRLPQGGIIGVTQSGETVSVATDRYAVDFARRVRAED